MAKAPARSARWEWGLPHRGRISPEEAAYVWKHLDEVQQLRAVRGVPLFDPAAVPSQRRHPGLAARGRRGAAHCPPTGPLESRGWAVLHDLTIPGSPANIDHLVIGPGGVLLIDSKQYRGRLRLDQYEMVWHGRHLLVSAQRKVLWAADQTDEVLGVADVRVAAVVYVHGIRRPGVCCRPTGSLSSRPGECPTCCRP